MDNNLPYLAILNDYSLFDYDEIRVLMNRCSSLQDLWNAPDEDILNLLRTHKVHHFLKIRKEENLIRRYKIAIQDLYNQNIEIISIFDKQYPESLKRVEGFPLIIYRDGNLKSFENCIAIVGTRRCSHFGHLKARELSRILARKGYTIVSGMARGIDTEAHCGALDVDGRTIAVLASDVKKVYPPENEDLMVDIRNNGAILSSSSPLKTLERGGFVERNRIISGISKCLIAVESPPDSKGTEHQVKFAIRQGLKVFVPKPNDKTRLSYQGYEKLMRLGATSFENEEEILGYLETMPIIPHIQMVVEELAEYKIEKPKIKKYKKKDVESSQLKLPII